MIAKRYLGLSYLLFALTGCGDRGQQAQKHFDAALANTSTAPSIVRIELNQDRRARVLCVYADDLIRALMAEHRLDGEQGYDEAVRLAQANERHSFAFQSRDAVHSLNLQYSEPERQQGCAIIATGRPAFQDDMTGQIREGLPFGDL